MKKIFGIFVLMAITAITVVSSLSRPVQADDNGHWMGLRRNCWTETGLGTQRICIGGNEPSCYQTSCSGSVSNE